MSEQNQQIPVSPVSVPPASNQRTTEILTAEQKAYMQEQIQTAVQTTAQNLTAQFQTKLQEGSALKATVEQLMAEKKAKEEAEAKIKAEEEARVKADAEEKKKQELDKLTLTQKVEAYKNAADEVIEKVAAESAQKFAALEEQLQAEKMNNFVLKKRNEIPESELPAYLFPATSQGETPEAFEAKLNQQKELYKKMKEDILKQHSAPEGSVLPIGSGHITKTQTKSWEDVQKLGKTELNALKDEVFKKYGI